MKKKPPWPSVTQHAAHHKDEANALNGTEHVTFPVNEFSLFHELFAGCASADGTRNVSVLSVSTSNTRFDSCTTLRSPIASSSFSFHSARACAESANSVHGPPSRPL